MKITILTNEYPPNVYGGAGVHVEYLTRELAALEEGAHEVDVLCFGEQDEEHGNLRVRGVEPDFELPHQDERHAKFMDAMARDLVMAGSVADADIIHGHTWYSHLAGCLAKQLTGGKLVLTTHSLEPHRPWKAEQLGTAYQGSSWVERTAYENADGVVAVSGSMKDDVQSLYDVAAGRVEVIHNGIDVEQYRPRPDESVLESYGVDSDQPYVLFVGRITRQKGILHLVEAIHHFDPDIQVVLCAGAPDTEEIGEEMEARVETARAETDNPIVWLAEMLPREDIITMYSHADVFVCPSVYEPFGIINLEAMACETPVVASAVGGIPEIVVPNETGLLVDVDPTEGESVEPSDPEGFARRLAEGVNALMADADRRRAMGHAARQRVEEQFSWRAIAEQTLDFYKRLLD
ncbi:glycosyl transferase family 1 [Salinibacter sp. 10B]|uniref:glycogen synthase n=1 Tax=Salinibacter sp. 10B TaxID=1923971 RepID=UPI000CF4F497|nr:glycogen synthase [Salinibacter sp. 10B]PQJ33795.1 glycosyl transferase family 1 [Salinibacter sp. 10B]